MSIVFVSAVIVVSHRGLSWAEVNGMSWPKTLCAIGVGFVVPSHIAFQLLVVLWKEFLLFEVLSTCFLNNCVSCFCMDDCERNV